MKPIVALITVRQGDYLIVHTVFSAGSSVQNPSDD